MTVRLTGATEQYYFAEFHVLRVADDPATGGVKILASDREVRDQCQYR